MHEDVALVSKEIYQVLKEINAPLLKFEEDFYTRFSIPLAVLEKSGFIKHETILASRIPAGTTLKDPSSVIYMCPLAENKAKMVEAIDLVDGCEPGVWIDGKTLSASLDLPDFVLNSIFKIYEAKGYGLVSKTINECKYLGKT